MTDYKTQFTQYQAKLGLLGNLEAELEGKQKEILTVGDQLEASRERLATLEGEVKDYLVSEIGDKDLPGISKAIEEGNYRQAYEMLQGLDEEEELEELLSKPVGRKESKRLETSVEVEDEEIEAELRVEDEHIRDGTTAGKNVFFLFDISAVFGISEISQINEGLEKAIEVLSVEKRKYCLAFSNLIQYDYLLDGLYRMEVIRDTKWIPISGWQEDHKGILMDTCNHPDHLHSDHRFGDYFPSGLYKESFDTLFVTEGRYPEDSAIAAAKTLAQKGKLTVLYLGEKDPTPEKNPEIMQMSEFAEVKCLPGYSRKQGDIETFMVEYARNIIEEEKGLRGKND